MRRILVNPHRKNSEVRDFAQVIENEELYKIDFSVDAADRSETISSVAWESKGSRELTFTQKSLTSSVAQAYISANYSGDGLVKCTATYPNSTVTQYIKLRIHDPEWRTN